MAPKKGRDLHKDAKFSSLVGQISGQYKTMGQMVYAVLKEAIVTGAFRPGEWLRQESLAEAIGVSRIPVRTALLQLESEGFVTFHPHRGAKVRSLTPDQLKEIYRLRSLLESYALRLSMARMTPQRLASLRQLARRLDAQHDGSEFIDVRVQFYRELYDTENNPMLVEMIEQLRSTIGRYLLAFRFDGPHEGNHQALVDKVADGDLAAAEAWLYEHLERVRRGIERVQAEEEKRVQAEEEKEDNELMDAETSVG